MRRGYAGADRALFWTFAIAAFAVAVAGLGARAVDRMAVGYERERNSYAIVRVIAPDGAPGMTAAQLALAQAPHVTDAVPMSERRAAELLSQWGGAPPAPGDMPPLRLIEVDLAPAAAQADVKGDIEAALAQGGVTAEVILAPASIAGGGMALRVRNLALLGAGIFAAVMALIVSLAARGVAARRIDYVTVLADLGATAAQAGGRVGDEAAALGLRAGLIGALAAGVVGILMLLMLAPGVTLDSLSRVLQPIDAAPLVIAPALAAIAAGMGARAGAESVHAQAARLA